MTHVGFYLLPTDQQAARDRFACRLIGKIFLAGHRVYVHTDDTARQAAFDDLLWEFQDDSLIPHRKLGDDSLPQAPVEIGCGDNPGDHHDVLVNLAHTVPPFFSRFERVAELVTEDDADRRRQRDAWRFYQDRGYPLDKHAITQL